MEIIRDPLWNNIAVDPVAMRLVDTPAFQRLRYVRQLGLAFPLLSDEDHAVAEAYGVWVEKSMYGRTYMGMERSTFVIDPAGVVTHVFRKVKPAEHDGLVLAALGATA